MKLLKTIVLVLLLGVVLVFAFQNFENVQISFINWRVEIPLSVAIVLIYLLGAISGGVLFNLIKKLTSQEKE
jgi:uncharacterized integral membrane protein